MGKIQIGEPKAYGKGIGRKSIAMIVEFGFETLSLKSINSLSNPLTVNR